MAALIIILVIVILICICSRQNQKAMQSGIDAALNEIKRHAEVTEEDAGEYHTMRISGFMHFAVRQYSVKDIGNLSIMTMNAGLMQMYTLILTPLKKDIPLISTDYIYVFGRRTCYLEYYDLILEKDEHFRQLSETLKALRSDYSDMKQLTPSSDWYDDLRNTGIYVKASPADDKRMENALVQWISAVMTYAERQPELTAQEQKEKLKAVTYYTHGLIEKGGTSTNVFIKALGKDKTRTFFDRVLFGTDQ